MGIWEHRAGTRGPDLADRHVAELAAVVEGPAAVVAALDGTGGSCRQQDALGAALERDLACCLAGAFPQCDHGRTAAAGWPGAVRHAEGRQRQDGRARVI